MSNGNRIIECLARLFSRPSAQGDILELIFDSLINVESCGQPVMNEN